MYYLYILYSSNFDRYYIGQTQNLIKRLDRHNKGWVKSTKSYLPWEIVYSEEFNSRSESMSREKFLKSLKSKKRLVELIDTSR